MSDARAGAVAVFEGRVRDHNDGRGVDRLEYEAFEALALSEGDQIIADAKARFEIHHVHCIHRTGTLEIGDAAVWVGVSASHRAAAFDACRYVIDEIKTRLPIWKREFYADGAVEWVNCRQCAHDHAHSEAIRPVTEADYYARQVILPEVSGSGQDKLRQARVLVVGAGGLGSAALPYLAGAGVGTLGIAEFDTLDASNLHRQVLYQAADCGQPKAELAKRQLEALNPFIRVETHPEGLQPDNAEALCAAYDIILDCTDNRQTRFLLADAAVRTGTPLIQAAVHQYEGQLSLYLPRSGHPCPCCLWPEDPSPDEAEGGACMAAGVLGVTPGLLGVWQAAEALKLILGMPSPLVDHLLLVNLLSCEVQRIRVFRDPGCPACGTTFMAPSQVAAGGRSLPQAPSLPDVSTSPAVRPDEVAAQLPEDFIVVDLREPHECLAESSDPLDGLNADRLAIPFSQWSGATASMLDRPILLVCTQGFRSLQLAQRLRATGQDNVFSLAGGVAALRALKPAEHAARLQEAPV